MNKEILQGKVKFLEEKSGISEKTGREWKTWRFNLNSLKPNGQWNSLPCETWSDTIGNSLQEECFIELTSYLPENKSYVDKNGQKKSWFSIHVSGIKIMLENGAMSGEINSHSTPELSPEKHQVKTTNTEEFNVDKYAEMAEKEFAETKICECGKPEHLCTCQVTDLDWVQELNRENQSKHVQEVKPIPTATFNFSIGESAAFAAFINFIRELNLEHKVLSTENEFKIEVSGTQNQLDSLSLKFGILTGSKEQNTDTNTNMPESAVNPTRLSQINQELQKQIDTSEKVIEVTSAGEDFEKYKTNNNSGW